MPFGKRPSTLVTAASHDSEVQQPLQPDPRGRRTVFPDDVSNLAPNASSINAALERSKAAYDVTFADAVRRVRSTMPSAEIRPFSLIPDVVWNSPAGVFLMTTLELYPYDAWNIMYLAADERTAMVLDLAPHPGKDVPAFVQASQTFMDRAQAHMDKVRAHVAETETWATFPEIKDDMRDRVKSMAMLFSRRIADAWAENSPNRGGRTH